MISEFIFKTHPHSPDLVALHESPVSVSPATSVKNAHPALASGILWAIGIVSMLMENAAARSLFGGPVDKGIIKDQEPNRLWKKGNNQPGQLHSKSNSGPFSVLEPFVIGIPTAHRVNGKPCFCYKSCLGQHRSDQQLNKGRN